jgi:predicted HAD superfamily phosphohydrolase YqeG
VKLRRGAPPSLPLTLRYGRRRGFASGTTIDRFTPARSFTGHRPHIMPRVTFIGMATEHLVTLRQTIPRLRHVLSHVEPTFRFDTVAKIDAPFLIQRGIHAVLWDVDGTLMAYHAADIDVQFPLVRALFRDGPARHAILSNCDEQRFEQLGRIFPEVPLLRGYRTDDGPVFRHLWQGADTHTPEGVRRILSHGGTQIRKPSGDLVRYGMRVLDETDSQAVLVVGDQYLTDIASANLAGALSAKVPTFRQDTFPMVIRLSQRLENAVYRLVRRRSGW